MATTRSKKTQTTPQPEVQIENALGKTEQWFEKNWRILVIIVAAVLVSAAIVYAYEGLYKVPQGRKASEAMFVAQQLFGQGNYSAALNGDGDNLGFLEIVDKFSGTKEARLAAHYAGVCYLKEGGLDDALLYLKKYKAVKGVPGAIVNAQNWGLRGDIYVQKGEYSDAVVDYKKAIDASDNELTAPLYLKKLGLALQAQGDNQAAIEAYQKILDLYPTSTEGREAEKLINLARF